ncbi:MAG: hypothetical protein AWM53_01070 [Candidatus Dichloromethanomonas elyunquensis]|nr:MAG: hypothetical protein AWM53_01070 [Candidatus Dichloromethanomonas elyunquensis]
MSNRTVIALLGLFSAVIFVGISITSQYALLGILAGFITGLVNIQWLFQDAQKAVEQELHEALKAYHKSLFSRLGMVTLVVAITGRFRPEWLFSLVLGIAAGVIIPLIIAIRQQLKNGRG